MNKTILTLALLLATHAQADTAKTAAERKEIGNRVEENIPAVPAELIEQLNQYQNTRGAGLAGWTADGCLLIGTRFAETSQAHRVCQPLGMREQLTFYKEPVSGLTPAPVKAWRHGFVFSKDKGGDEFSQLYWFDQATRAVVLLTDGKRSQNGGALISDDGVLMAYRSTSRNGTDTDIWIRNTKTGEAKPLLTEGGSWAALDFSNDGKTLLVSQYKSVNDSRPGKVDIATGKLTLFPVDGGTAAFDGFEYAKARDGVFFVSDENSEFLRLRFHDLKSGQVRVLSENIPWDVTGFTQSPDGKSLAFVTNEDGISKVHVLDTKTFKPRKLPALPIGVVGGVDFSPESGRLAVGINSATSPSDVYVIDLQSSKLTRWTQSEVGGLDARQFVSPTLIRYPSFDGRSIPAFLYQPRDLKPGERVPVLINIHGGPEAQSFPSFNPSVQYMLKHLRVAVLIPNVRGSSGYGKTYLQLDNGFLRKDSVKDIGALLDWVDKQPQLDNKRIGVYGGSYGGYMTLATLVDYGARLRAGIDVVGISHFVTFLNNTESYRRDLRRVEYGDERDPKMKAFMDGIAPLNNAKKIASPLFVAQGKNDPRVPYTEAEQITKAVRDGGTPVWFLMFNDEGHGFAKKPNSDHFGAASILFWKEYLLK